MPNCKKLAHVGKGTDVERLSSCILGSIMRETSKTYAAFVCGALFIAARPANAHAQLSTSDMNRPTCAAVLSDSNTGARVGPGTGDSTARRDSTRGRPDTVSFGLGGA